MREYTFDVRVFDGIRTITRQVTVSATSESEARDMAMRQASYGRSHAVSARLVEVK